MKKPIAFFDRDGVLNVDSGYVWRSEDWYWMPGAPETIRALNQKGFHVVVVTNQSGVARGFYEESDVRSLHEWMNVQLAEWDAHIDAFYYCPHHIEGSIADYVKDCDCRKPNPGMIRQAVIDFDADVSRSFLIGDRESDLQAAAAAGIQAFLFSGGNLHDFYTTNISVPHLKQ